MANAWRISQEMGIRIVSKKGEHRKGPLEPRQTRSRASIKSVAEHGEAIGYPDMVYDVLGLFLASEGNQRQLFGENIIGVSLWMKAANIRTSDIPFLTPAFNEIDMGLVRSLVLHHKIPHRAPQIGNLVAGMMEDAVEAIDLKRKLNVKS